MTARPSWIAALGATLLMQSVASFLTQSLPVLAPLVTASAGLPPETIGHLNALAALGTVLFLLLGGPFLARWGPVRTLQIGAALSAGAMLLLGLGTPAALLLASLLLGLGYGPSPPAGSRILAASAPKGHRTLIFSVKQAGAPLGGACAGLVTAAVAERFGWPAALLLAVAVALLAAAAIQPLKPGLDAERNAAEPIGPRAVLQAKNWKRPLRALRLHPALPPLTVLAVSFAALQGCLFAFTVTWMEGPLGLSLAAAGGVFAAMQGTGVVARILLGWLADRGGAPMRNLLVQGVAASVAGLLFALLAPAASPLGLHLLAALCGFVAASWNGIYLAEVARLVPPAEVAAATSGSTLFTFLGYLAAPALFALLISAGLGWGTAFAIVAAQLGFATLLVALALRRNGMKDLARP
jgi:MFS family permease